MQKSFKRFSLFAGFALMAALLIANELVTKNQIDRQIGSQERVAHTRQVLFQLEQIDSTLKDAESGQRGYLLTGDDKYLASYSRAIVSIEPLIDDLMRLTVDNPVQQKNIAELRGLTREKLDELARTISLYRSRDAAQAMSIVASDEGLVTMDKIRLVLAQMRGEETRLESIRMASYRQSQHRTAVSIWLATLAALLGLIALAWYIVREQELRARHENELAAQAEWLRTTLTSIGDAVIATDRSGIVTFLNPVAEKLTGHGLDYAKGKPIEEIFPIFNEITGKRVVDPVEKVIELGAVVGLANHTVLQNSAGPLIPIDDSAAPIRNERDELIGVVLVFRDVSELRRAEDESRRLAAIVSSSDDAIISKNTNGVMTSWNRGAARIFGYSAEEMIGQPISILYPDDRKHEWLTILDRVKRGEHIDHFQSVRRTKDGRLIHVSLSVSPLYDANGEVIGASKILRDVTAQIEAQKEIALQRERLQVTLRSIGDGVIATDTQGRVSFLNPVAEQLTGWASEEAVGRPVDEVMRIFNEQSRQPAENPVTKVLREGRVVGLANHTVLVGRDGKEIAIDDSAAPIRDDRGEMIGVVLVFRDVTAERRSMEIMRRADKLTAAARLSATMAHEINNPLAAVVNLIFIVKNMPGIPAVAVHQLVQVEQELERVAHITRQALGFYRETRAPEPVEIAALVESVLRLYSNKLVAKDITVRRTFDACPPIQGIVGELRQAISNLIANAIDAVEQGGVIMVAAHAVPIGSDCLVEVVVADDGPGIAPAHIGRIFEPFFTTKKDVGTGLGLWAAKTIVDRHGGTITVRSQQDEGDARGAAFTIQLPCTSAREPGEASGKQA